MLYVCMRLVTFALLKLLFRYHAVGVERVPRQGPLLLAANHASVLDPPVVGAGVPRELHFMAKAELFRIPLLGSLIRRLNAHPIEREGADARALRHALGLLSSGQAVLVFPEGTRGVGGRLGPGRPGAGMLAVLSGVPVVPVYIEGAGPALPRGARCPRLRRITVIYGRPMEFARGRGRTRYQAASDVIMAAIAELRTALPRDAPGTAKRTVVGSDGWGPGARADFTSGRNAGYGTRDI